MVLTGALENLQMDSDNEGGPTQDLLHPCRTLDDCREEKVRARSLQIKTQHPQASAIPLQARPLRLSDTPVQYRIGPPQGVNTRTKCCVTAWGFPKT